MTEVILPFGFIKKISKRMSISACALLKALMLLKPSYKVENKENDCVTPKECIEGLKCKVGNRVKNLIRQ
jgi:hypothetical protein